MERVSQEALHICLTFDDKKQKNATLFPCGVYLKHSDEEHRIHQISSNGQGMKYQDVLYCSWKCLLSSLLNASTQGPILLDVIVKYTRREEMVIPEQHAKVTLAYMQAAYDTLPLYVALSSISFRNQKLEDFTFAFQLSQAKDRALVTNFLWMPLTSPRNTVLSLPITKH